MSKLVFVMQIYEPNPFIYLWFFMFDIYSRRLISRGSNRIDCRVRCSISLASSFGCHGGYLSPILATSECRDDIP